MYYTQAIEENEDYNIYGNRSITYFMMKQYEDSLKDAETATKLKKDWVKGWYRQG